MIISSGDLEVEIEVYLFVHLNVSYSLQNHTSGFACDSADTEVEKNNPDVLLPLSIKVTTLIIERILIQSNK